jgi:NAD(P)-dependent dehydrogenase (short-subunit alcohol dehydrogenase family)
VSGGDRAGTKAGPGPLEGRVCLVTGATSGIGAVAARELCRLGATVVLSGRDAGRCARQLSRIRAEVPGARAEALVADLSVQAEVRRLAEAFTRRHARLDVLVNDAGAYYLRRQISRDGVELTLALNHLAPFTLTLLLLDRLLAAPAARVVNVSSVAHARSGPVLEDLQRERRYERIEAYARSKLANLLFTFELARRLAGTPVTANAVHPGMVATHLGANDGWLRARLRNAKNLLRRTMVTAEEGARPLVHLACSPELEAVSGRYFDGLREAQPSPASRDEAVAAELWRASEVLTGVRWDDVAAAVRARSAAP